jgi:Na+-transporting NADH:ubiquinone oxidoreductase subunit NqrB
MSVPALPTAGGFVLRIGGSSYPVLLPTWRDARLHLGAVIVSLQALGQVAFGFRISIAQILVSVLTCAVLEVGIAFWRQRAIMWPASALLTGNGVAFILRVPGTEHGDWWSLNGAWIFATAGAVSLLSKYLVRIEGRHVFNPSNFGLALVFLILGSDRADPLDFWWAPMSAWMALALAIIIAGGFAILWRLRLLEIAVAFWLTFAACMAVLSISGHAMTARWDLDPITGWHFWWVLVSSPEVLVFLFFMITDPKTVPSGRVTRRVFACSVAVVAGLLIAPQQTEFGSKVALLGALALVCLAAAVGQWVTGRAVTRYGGAMRALGIGRVEWPPQMAALKRMRQLALGGAIAIGGLLFVAGIPARPGASATPEPVFDTDRLPAISVVQSASVASQIDRPTALRIAEGVLAGLRVSGDALQYRDVYRAAKGATGRWHAELQRRILVASEGAIAVPRYQIDLVQITLEPGARQAPPKVVVTLKGTVRYSFYSGSPPSLDRSEPPVQFSGTYELERIGGVYLIAHARNETPGGAG